MQKLLPRIRLLWLGFDVEGVFGWHFWGRMRWGPRSRIWLRIQFIYWSGKGNLLGNLFRKVDLWRTHLQLLPHLFWWGSARELQDVSQSCAGKLHPPHQQGGRKWSCSGQWGSSPRWLYQCGLLNDLARLWSRVWCSGGCLGRKRWPSCWSPFCSLPSLLLGQRKNWLIDWGGEQCSLGTKSVFSVIGVFSHTSQKAEQRVQTIAICCWQKLHQVLEGFQLKSSVSYPWKYRPFLFELIKLLATAHLLCVWIKAW